MPYAAEVKCLMFINGDTDEPGEPAARLIENTVRLELLRLVAKCGVVGGGDDDVIRLEDVIFQLRSQVKLLIRIYRQMTVWDQKDRKERAEQLEPAVDLVDFRSRLRNTLNTECDPLKTASLNLQSDRISLLSDNEYEHFAYCKRASFGGFLSQRASHYGVCMNSQQDQLRRRMQLKSTKMEQAGAKPRVERLQRFRDWLIDGKMQHSTQIDDFALEALIVAANELTGLLVRRALIDRASRESGSGMGQLEPGDVEHAYCTLTDMSNVEPLANVKKRSQSILENYTF